MGIILDIRMTLQTCTECITAQMEYQIGRNYQELELIMPKKIDGRFGLFRMVLFLICQTQLLLLFMEDLLLNETILSMGLHGLMKFILCL